MYGNRHGSRMPGLNHHVVAAFNPIYVEPKVPQRSNSLFPVYSWEVRHSANPDKLFQFREPSGGEPDLVAAGLH